MSASRLLTLLGRWQEAFEKGIDLSAAELCPDDSEVTRQLRPLLDNLRQINREGNGVEERRDKSPAVSPPVVDSAATIPPRPDAPVMQGSDGVHVPGYEILSELGRGGMGVVYKARQVDLDRVVALKMILAGDLAGETDLARFTSEAKAIARLRHPNIVAVYEVGEHDGKPYFSLEFCDGGSLDRMLAGRPLSPMKAATLVQTLAQAMQAAHEAHVVHRDLKPANVLLAACGLAGPSSDFTPKITDFGLAKKLDEAGQTTTGAIMGTASYMAPEQAEGKKSVGPAADVYALGAILYECLTGRPPFRAATAFDTIMQVLSEEPVPPRQLNMKVPLDLETVTLKCLEKEPLHRYETALTLADDLGRFLAGKPVQARPIGAVERGWRWARRNPVVASLGTAVAMVLLVGTVVAWLLASWALGEKGRAQEKASEALIRTKQADDQRDRAEGLLYASKLAQAQRMWQDGKITEALGLLDGCQWNLRGWEHRHLWTLIYSNQVRLQEAPVSSMTSVAYSFRGGPVSSVTSVAYSPDGKFIVSGDADGKLKVWDVEKGKQVLSFKGHADQVDSVAYSPDGKRIVSSGAEKTLRVWDAQTGQAVHSLKGHNVSVKRVAYSADGKRIISGSGEFDPKTGKGYGEVKVWDAQTGQELFFMKGHTRPVASLACSPDDKHIVSGSSDGTVKVWDAQTGREVYSLEKHSDRVSCVAYSPDGKYIVSTSWGTLKLSNAQTGQEIRSFKGRGGFRVGCLAYSPDGKWIVLGGEDHMLVLWNAQTGQEVRSFKGHTKNVSCVAYSPNGKGFVSGSLDGRLLLWDADRAQSIFSFRGHGQAVASVAFSPDGKRIVSGGGDKLSGLGRAGFVKECDAETGQVIRSLKGHTELVSCVAYSPDGKRIVSAGVNKVPGKPGELKVWDADNDKVVLSLQGHAGSVLCLAYSPDGNHIVSGGGKDLRKPGELKVWDATNGKLVRSLDGHTGPVSCVAYSPDGKCIVSGSYRFDGIRQLPGELWVWGGAKCGEILALRGHSGWVLSVAFSPDGKHIASASQDGALKVWDIDKGQEVLSLNGPTKGANRVAYSPDGKRMVSGHDDTLMVWDARTGQALLSLKAPSQVTDVAFSPDGNRIVAGSFDGRLTM
jgi:WD40 repeat protein